MTLSAAEWLSLPPLSQRFYAQGAAEVAPMLLGKALVHVVRGQPIVGEIVEVEAYLGLGDPASHTYRGLTPRTRPMFEAGGICYVYLSYGVNYCMNVVTGRKGDGEAVLLRALAPLHGIERMAKNRGVVLDERHATLRNVACGPGKLTKALGVDLRHNGSSFRDSPLRIVDFRKEVSHEVATSPRIGITKAVDLPLRFFVKDSRWLSR